MRMSAGKDLKVHAGCMQANHIKKSRMHKSDTPSALHTLHAMGCQGHCLARSKAVCRDNMEDGN